VFALSRSLTLSVILLFMAGFSMVTQVASSNTIIQTVVAEDKRGRIMSLFAMSFMGIMPFGSMLAGAVAARIGVPHTLLLGGTCCITGALVFAVKLPTLVELLRPVFGPSTK
jgi:MFS family permease